MIIEKGNIHKEIEIKSGKALIFIKIGDHYVNNPSLIELFEDGWHEFIPSPDPDPVFPSQEKMYHSLVEAKIREVYTESDELGFLRQRDTKPEEFEEYNAFVEQCKREAHIEIYGE